jgi:hypothetical protein
MIARRLIRSSRRNRQWKRFTPVRAGSSRRDGNPPIEPWKHLAALADEFAIEEFLLGSWHVCRGTKSVTKPCEQRRDKFRSQ